MLVLEVAEETGQQMNNLLFEWARLAADDIALVYSSRGQTKDKTKAVLMRPMEMEQSKGQWPVANSLREVEAEIDVVLKNYGGGTT